MVPYHVLYFSSGALMQVSRYIMLETVISGWRE
jgi:hypothetical protein